MPLVKRLAKAFTLGVLVGVATFVVIFVGGLAWEVNGYPADGQTGLEPFIYGVVIAPLTAMVAFVRSFMRH